MSTISFADFQQLDLKVGTVTIAEQIEESDKLVRLEVDLGEETRQLVAGIADILDDPNELVGQQLVVLTNLEPKKLMGYESQGMILAADADNLPVLLHPASEVPAGSKVH